MLNFAISFLSSVVGRAVWFREFCVVDYVVLVMWIGFVFDRKVGANCSSNYTEREIDLPLRGIGLTPKVQGSLRI